jgi:hypothetical protein
MGVEVVGRFGDEEDRGHDLAFGSMLLKEVQCRQGGRARRSRH